YLTADLTASAGQDYTAVSGTLTFMDGETSKTFDVPIADNNSNEADETLALLLRNPASPDAAASQSIAVLTIQNHNRFVTLSIDSISVAEGDVGTSNAVFTVSLSAATGRTITVDYSTAPLDATPNVDYQSVAGSLTFNPRV